MSCKDCGKSNVVKADKPCIKCGSTTDCRNCNPRTWECEICQEYYCSKCQPKDDDTCESCNDTLQSNHQEERFGAEEEQQVCLGCGDARKLWYEPFTPCDTGCGRYICRNCLDTNRSEFCYCCFKCGDCANLLSCANCSRYGCADAKNDECEMHKCRKCGQGTCQECESDEKCVGCDEDIKALWYLDNREEESDEE